MLRLLANDRLPWLLASGLSFSTRVGIAHFVPGYTDSRLTLPVQVYLTGMLVNWAFAYPLYRWQDRRDCRLEDGSFDEQRYRAGTFERLLFLPKQELGYLGFYSASMWVVMNLSTKWPVLFGSLGTAAALVPAMLLQGFCMKYYKDIWRRLEKGLGLSDERSP